MFWSYVLLLRDPHDKELMKQTIKCLLIYPNPESALDEEAGKQLLADYDGYCKVSIPALEPKQMKRG
jgi:hypothetical protein